MQSYSNNSDYDQRRSNTQREYAQEFKDSNKRYSRTGTDYSSADAHLKPDRDGSIDLNGYQRSPLIHEQHYEAEGVENSLDTREKESLEMNDQANPKPIPGRPNMYDDFNNNYQGYSSLTKYDTVLEPVDIYESDYTDRDFPGGGKNARQSIAGENLVIVKDQESRCCCCSRKICIIITFIILVIIAIVLYFVWPRIPSVSIDGNQTLSSPNTNPIIRQQPPLVDLIINVQVLIDNRENWVPYKFNHIDVQVFDTASSSTFNDPIATGNVTSYVLQPRAVSTLVVPIHVLYQTTKGNDPTFQDLLGACIKSSGAQKFLNLKVNLKLYIAGIDWIYKPEFSISVSDFKCPYSL
ncbi:8173_t:CDS:2 [Acaulospora morrowiae]|uniref:8173_t:CDS:1 n=1 Tax=Acaulospora morrowiae TaxID=94023 RepID=A0A9N9ACD6_9GLOM|nr:8173_t:CDS:2 [Acaulospora morrowiae]